LNNHRWIRMMRPGLKQSHKFLEFLTDLIILLESLVGNISEIKFHGYFGHNEILLQSNETNGQLMWCTLPIFEHTRGVRTEKGTSFPLSSDVQVLTLLFFLLSFFE